MVCQKEGLNFQELMDTNKIILVKLSHGLIGEENSHLLGSFIVSKLQQTAMARQAQHATARVLFTCYIDEFQNYVTPSLSTILQGARKYNLSLVLAHQEVQQITKIDPSIASTVLANTATRICFKLSDHDAKQLQDGFTAFTAEDLQNLNTGEAIVRVNTKDQDFNISVIPFEQTSHSLRDAIIHHSRTVYTTHTEPPITPPEPPPVSTAPEPPPQAAPPVDPLDEQPSQKEDREHRQLQMFIKKLAEQHGYKANIEVLAPDGTGRIDVLFEKDGQVTACEISVTTPAAWELHNIRKCLAAGYTTVVCTTTKAKAAAIQKRIAAELTPNEQLHVSVITKDEIPTMFSRAKEEPQETVYKGYRVKVEYGQSKSDLQEQIVNRFRRSGK